MTGHPPRKRPVVYLIGSLRNPGVLLVSSALRSAGIEVFDDWYAAGERADDAWRDYELNRGHSFKEALDGYAANHVFTFDKYHLDRARIGVLVLPAGKSGHLELGYLGGQQKPIYILLDSPDRWDVMYKFATGVAESIDELVQMIPKFPDRG